jgi:hypothetical protein
MKYNSILAATGILIIHLLTGCLGGGTSNSNTAQGIVNVSITDGPGDDYDHVWVTIKAISFHTDPNIAWNINNPAWQTTTLPAPVTLDLANLSNGSLNQVFSGMSLSVGSYKQIRIFLAGFDDTLTSSAQSASLSYNDQVDYTDYSVTPNVVHHVPLEIAYPIQGIQLNGTFTVTTASTLDLGIDFDLEHDLVPFVHSTGTLTTENYYTLKPNLRYFDLNQSGAITGYVDTTHLCTTAVASNCGYNLIAKAEILSADGSRHIDTRATRVQSDGSFTLFPLPSGTKYDVLIRGRNIETMLVKTVTAPVASRPSSGAAVLSTVATPISLTINSSEYFAKFSTPLMPTSGYAAFQQTLPNSGSTSEVPYEIRWSNTNPYTGTLQIPIALSSGQLHVANYISGNTLSFSNVIPQELTGSFTVSTNGLPLVYYTMSTGITVSAPVTPNTITTPLTFTPSTPSLTSSVYAGTVSGNINQTIPGYYNKGYLVISRFANIVDTLDISGYLATSGTYSVTLPAGTPSAPVPGAYYYGYLRVWNNAHPVSTMKVIPINSMIDLRNTNSISGLNIMLL